MPEPLYIREVLNSHCIEYPNPALCRLLGYTPEELIGQPICILFADEDRERLCDITTAAEHGASPLDRHEARYRHKTGRTIFVELTRQLYDRNGQPCEESGEDGEWALVFVHDVTVARERSAVLEACIITLQHELKTPLNAVIGYDQMLLEGLCGPLPPPITEYLEIILESGQLMGRFVEALLYATMYSEYELHEESLDVARLSGLATKMLAQKAKEKNLELRFHVDITAKLVADPTLVELMLLNLVRNAIAYTKQGEIEVWFEAIDGAMAMQVRDTGIGISSEHHARIFEPLYRVNPGIRGGQGLGLSIVARFAQLHDASISLVSEPGIGSTFTVLFPTDRTMP